MEDNGIGIPAKFQHAVFDMLSVSRRSGTAGEKSHGLGLSICRHIVDLHQGKISFTSEEGNGTVFHVELPLTDPSA